MKTPLYETIFSDLKESIENGSVKINEKLPTEKELAEKYEVSTITVKKALDLLKEAGYIERKPRKGSTVISQTKSSSKTNKMTIGIVITNFTDFFGSQIIRSIITTYSIEINFILKISYGDTAKENELIQELLDSEVQGLLLLPSSSEYISPKILELVSRDFPIVIIDRSMANLPICTVQTNNTLAAKELTNYLFEKGHKKIGLISSDSMVSTIDQRADGFLTTYLQANLPVRQSQILNNVDSVVPNSTRTIEEDVQNIVTFIQKNQDLTAIFATEYNIALLVKNALTFLDKKIPDDMSLVCFDHSTINAFDKNAAIITHIEQNQTEMGIKSVELLLKKIKNPKLIEKISLDFTLIEGNSVRNN